jgi:hypothetical protein
MDDYLLKVERNLMLGGGRWVADFNEAFRNFPLGDHVFDLLVRGGTRPKGFLLSRLFAYFSLPSYKVAVFVKHVPEDEFDLEDLIRAVTKRATEKNTKWTWLVLLRRGGFTDKAVERVSGFDRPELGISLVNLAAEDVETTPNLLGRKAPSLFGIFR